MEVYFVRHGETAANRRHRYQSPEEPLNELGRQQAQAVAKRLARHAPTRIITSPFSRAYETAKVIGGELGLPVVTHTSFIELKRPRVLYGYSHFGLKSLYYMVRWFFLYKDPHWREAGGESYQMFLDRLEEAREYLEGFSDHERIVVVSHSIFINFFVEHICERDRMNWFEAFMRLTKIKALDNSSLTKLEFQHSDAKGVCTWVLRKFDDDDHVIKVLKKAT